VCVSRHVIVNHQAPAVRMAEIVKRARSQDRHRCDCCLATATPTCCLYTSTHHAWQKFVGQAHAAAGLLLGDKQPPPHTSTEAGVRAEKTQPVRVCSSHFLHADYLPFDLSTPVKHRRLKKGAVPSKLVARHTPSKRGRPCNPAETLSVSEAIKRSKSADHVSVINNVFPNKINTLYYVFLWQVHKSSPSDFLKLLATQVPSQHCPNVNHCLHVHPLTRLMCVLLQWQVKGWGKA
jgi:hypothetical protein